VTETTIATHPAEPGALRPSRGYRRLAVATVVATFALIIVGGIVRVSDSGLGCGPGGSGFHGWPFCNGDVVPGLSVHSVIEYTHRALAGTVTILMFALAVLAFRSYRAHRTLLLATTGGFVLILAQAALGGATVEHDLNPGLVAAHLGLAMLLLGLLLYVVRLSGRWTVDSGQDSGPGFPRWLAIAATAAVFCTIVAGGYMAGTQKYGRPDYQLGDGAHHACGKQFPTCNGGFMPFGESRLVNIHLTHRAFMYLASILLIALITVALRRRVAVRSARLLAALLVAQILVGALNVWLDEYEAMIVLHLALGTLLWAASVGFMLQLAPARERAPRARAVAA
jgi:heme A synthase